MSGVNRDALVGLQPGQHTGANLLCKFGLKRDKRASADVRQAFG